MKIASTKPRLFVDMDGTLAEWKNIKTEEIEETLYLPDYFKTLKPHEKVINAIKALYASGEVEIFILSCVLPDRGSISPLKQKNEWIDIYLKEIDYKHRIFVPDGKDKKSYVPFGIRENDTLLDDFTKNLDKWVQIGRGIKLLNNINSSKGTWIGPRISYSENALDIKEDILDIILRGKNIKHANPNRDKIIEPNESFLEQGILEMDRY